MPLRDANLGQFTGSEEAHSWSILFRNMFLSDGAKFVADNGGTSGCYWLMDVIASHQRKAMQFLRLQEFQIWVIKVDEKKGSCTVACYEDYGAGHKPKIIQRIPYTDFDLPEMKLYVGPIDSNKYMIYLPSEY